MLVTFLVGTFLQHYSIFSNSASKFAFFPYLNALLKEEKDEARPFKETCEKDTT